MPRLDRLFRICVFGPLVRILLPYARHTEPIASLFAVSSHLHCWGAHRKVAEGNNQGSKPL
eukprot:5115167-Alexandrium_andersonii.AAC.1